jgi:solute carrier family 25 protein 42
MTGVAPYAGLKFGIYDGLKAALQTYTGKSEGELPWYVRVGSGSFAGLVAYTLVYPFDVVRRRMQTGTMYSGVAGAFTTIAREEGIVRGLFRGLSLNYLKVHGARDVFFSVDEVYVRGAGSYMCGCINFVPCGCVGGSECGY